MATLNLQVSFEAEADLLYCRLDECRDWDSLAGPSGPPAHPITWPPDSALRGIPLSNEIPTMDPMDEDFYRPSFFELVAQGGSGIWSRHILQVLKQSEFHSLPVFQRIGPAIWLIVIFLLDQLRELLGPVIRYVTSVFAQRYPRYLLKLVNHHDELFAMMMYFIERYYLKNWSTSKHSSTPVDLGSWSDLYLILSIVSFMMNIKADHLPKAFMGYQGEGIVSPSRWVCPARLLAQCIILLGDWHHAMSGCPSSFW